MRNVSLRHIETLQAIAAAGSLVQAAATLSMTPAALTARVKGLEEAVGLKLFDRTSTGMRLTKRRRGGARSVARRRAGHARICRHDARDQFRRRRPTFRRRDVHREIFRAAAHRGLCPQPTEGRPALSDRQSRRDDGIAAQRRSRDRACRTSASRHFRRDVSSWPPPLCPDRASRTSPCRRREN